MKQILVAFAFLLFVSCKPKEQASKDSHEAWNTATTLTAYEKYGSKNPKWDSDAKRCLTEYLKLRNGITNYEQRNLSFELTGAYAYGAVQKGCDDPLVEYLYCRFGTGLKNDELTTRLCSVADKMETSQYAPVRKFFPNLRASQNLWKNRDTNLWDRVAQYETAAINNFIEIARDKTVPVEEIDETGNELVETVLGQDWALKLIIDGAEPLLMQNWPKKDATHALLGSLHFYYAWGARGYGYQVTPEQAKGFQERLEVATKFAQTAWALNPKNTRIPTLMVKLAEGTQKPRAEMETWFARAMELEPNNYQACQAKLHYLYPQWYGSEEEMVRFGRECVASETWTGTVPLILVDAHDQIAAYILNAQENAAYWKQPEVWKDIASAYDRFFERNPDGVGWHHNYAKYAYRCEQWETLNEQIKLLGDVNYSFFGGEPEFDKMVKLAKAHATKGSDK